MLLTVPLGRRGAGGVRPLTPTEWGEFAGWLKDEALAPGDLLKSDLTTLLGHWDHRKVTTPRVQALLNRGAALGFALEKWQRAGLWVVTRSDAGYPRRLKQLLGRTAPAVLFGCGNRDLLGASSIAVVGSRHAGDADIDFAESIGRHAAESGELVVSGGAAGVDQAAMFGALHAEGTAIGVLGDGLLRAATLTRYRKHLMSGDLALVSPFNPESRFMVGNAMARNKYIYCLAHDAIVVTSATESGGTWKGAVENLRQGWVPLWVKRTEAPDSGNPDLVALGGRWLEGVRDPAFNIQGSVECVNRVGQRDDAATEHLEVQAELTIAGEETRESSRTACEAAPVVRSCGRETSEAAAEANVDPAEDLYQKVRSLAFVLCAEPKQSREIAGALGVTKPTADAWVQRLVEESVLKRLPSPVRYVTREKDLLQAPGERTVGGAGEGRERAS